MDLWLHLSINLTEYHGQALPPNVCSINRISYQAKRQAGKALVQPVVENELQARGGRNSRVAVKQSIIGTQEQSVSAWIKVDPGDDGVPNKGVVDTL